MYRVIYDIIAAKTCTLINNKINPLTLNKVTILSVKYLNLRCPLMQMCILNRIGKQCECR